MVDKMAKWMISYRFKLENREYDQIQTINCHPARFLCDLEASGDYKVVRLYGAILVPPKTLKRGEGDFDPEPTYLRTILLGE